MLQAGADPNARTESKLTPLHLAAGSNENPAVTQALLQAGADPNARDDDKSTPLHEAARNNENPAVTQALLQAGANPNAQTNYKSTPLHEAAGSNENPAVTQALLQAGADANAQDKYKDTPLHQAALLNDNPAVRQILLAAGNTHMERTYRSPKKKKGGWGGLGALIAGAAAGAAVGAGVSAEDALEAGVAIAGSVMTGQQSSGNPGGPDGGGSCEIPGYPRPANVANLGLSWCPATVDFQARAFALQAAGAQCAIATGSSSTPEQIQARRQEIQAACARLAALGVSNCRCP